MKHRFFRAAANSPLHAEIARITEQCRSAHAELKAFLEAEGCCDLYGSSPADYRFDFKTTAEADPKKWAQEKRRVGRGITEILFRPKRNTPEGKALAQRIKALPECPQVESAISVVPGLHYRSPMVLDGMSCYSAFIRYFAQASGLLIVAVPSPDVEPAKLAAYAEQANSQNRTEYNGNMDTALWQPPAWLTEMKEWEALQAIDQDGEAGA